MDKKELKKALNDVAVQIKNNSKDAKFADKLLDKLLSLKGQMDVEATRLIIKESDVVKEYDFGSFRIVKCKSGIMFQDKGGFTSFVTPRMEALFVHFMVLLDMKDNYDNLSDDKKKTYDCLFTATNWIMNAPVYSTVDDETFFGTAIDIAKRFEACVEKRKNAELQDETHEENAEFENAQEAFKVIGGQDAESI